jgi:hypothetical protein
MFEAFVLLTGIFHSSLLSITGPSRLRHKDILETKAEFTNSTAYDIQNITAVFLVRDSYDVDILDGNVWESCEIQGNRWENQLIIVILLGFKSRNTPSTYFYVLFICPPSPYNDGGLSWS